jgi:ppGpp synthetase/RelA/SpoT-type nucleotidyltranferase
MPNISIETQKDHIEVFKKERPVFEAYKTVLKEVLEKAVQKYAPFGFVQARAKTIDSFSEKIIRKDKYVNPLTDMTDLCGARVVTHFSKQVNTICEFIECFII